MSSNFDYISLEEMEAATKGKSRRKLVESLMEAGVSKEVAYRLGEIWSYTKKVGDKAWKVGRIILAKIVEFVKQHAFAISGMALGAALSILVAHIPIIGPAIAPVIALIAIPVGILIGAKLDVDARKNGGSLEIVEELIRLAHDFFKLLIDAFKAVFPQTT